MPRNSEGSQNDRALADGKSVVRALAAFVTILLVLWPYALSFGDQGASVTVINRTRYYLHVVINNKAFLYVAPGGVVTYELSALSDAVVDVATSPGQEFSGKASRTLPVVRQDAASQSNTCSNNRRGDGCESSTNVSSSVSPVRWEVLPADLSSN